MRLSPRLRELVELVGGKGYSYGRAAREMGLDYWTVAEYAAEIRARAGLAMSPRAALGQLYHREVARTQEQQPKPKRARKKRSA